MSRRRQETYDFSWSWGGPWHADFSKGKSHGFLLVDNFAIKEKSEYMSDGPQKFNQLLLNL